MANLFEKEYENGRIDGYCWAKERDRLNEFSRLFDPVRDKLHSHVFLLKECLRINTF